MRITEDNNWWYEFRGKIELKKRNQVQVIETQKVHDADKVGRAKNDKLNFKVIGKDELAIFAENPNIGIEFSGVSFAFSIDKIFLKDKLEKINKGNNSLILDNDSVFSRRRIIESKSIAEALF